MKKFSLTHKLLAVALAFVLVAVSLPDYLSFAQQPAQEQSETDEFEDNLADGDPSDDDLSGDNPSDTGEQEMEQQVVLHLQAPETVPMGTAGSFGLSAQNTAAVAADVSIQLTQEEMAAYQAAEQDGTLALQPVGDSLTFTLQPGEQVEGTLSFLYPNGYSSREVVEIAEEDISIVLQQLPEEETGGTPIETIPPEGEIQPPEQGQTPPADETQQPGGEGPTDPSDEEEPTPPESGDGEEPTNPSDGGETTPPESGDGEEATDPSDGEDETLPPESGDGEEATDSSNEEETTPPDDETDPSVGEGGVMPSDEQEQVLQTVEQSTVSLTQDYQTGPDGELSEEPTTDSEPADESGTTENEGSTEPSGSESGNPTDLENTGSTDSDNAGTGDNSLSDTEDGDQQGNDPTGSQGDGQQGDDPTGSQGDGQHSDDPTGSQGDGQQDGDLTGSQGDGQQDGDLTGSQDNVQQGNDLTGSQDESGQEQPQVSFDIVGATLTFTASFGWGELTLTAQPLETEQQEAAAQETVPQPDLSYTIEAASQNRESTGTIYTRSWSLQQVIALPQGASFVEGEAAVDGNQIRIGTTPVLSVDDQSGTAGELSAQRDGETLLVTYTKILSDWQSLEAESISDLGLAMTLHQEAIVRDESFTEGQVDVGATFTATPVTAAAEIAPAAVLAVLDTGDEQQDGSQSVTQQGSLSLPLSGEPQAEQPQPGDTPTVTVTYEGEPTYTEEGKLAVKYTIKVTNDSELQSPSTGDEEEPDDSEGSVTVKIEQYFNAKGFSEEKPKVEQTDEQAQWDRDNQTLTWNDVTIEAGEEWSQTITVLIDTANLTSIDALPTNLISQAKVFDAESEDPENEPLATKEAEEIDLKTFVGEKISPVEGLEKEFEQDVYWKDNNDTENRPSQANFLSEIGLQYRIYKGESGEGEPSEESWITLDETMAEKLDLTWGKIVKNANPDTNEMWALSATLPTKIQYGDGSDEGLQFDIAWRFAAPEADKVGKLPGYYFYPVKNENENQTDWYYLKKQEVTFNIDFRDAVYDEEITAEEVKQLIEKHFVLYTQPGADPDREVKWNEIDWEVKGSNGDYTLTITNAVYYTINNEVVHYYLLANNETEGTIPINEDWPGKGQGDSYRIEYDNHNNPNVGTVTDKVYSGGTLVLTREGTVEYKATKEWITPKDRERNRPDGYFELYRYTYPGGSYQTAAPVHGVETVPFETNSEDDTQSIIFKLTSGGDLPKYDPEGNRYVYVMKEVLTDTGEDKDSYEQIFGKVGSDGEVAADSDQGPPEDVREGNWERESNDNFVYNGGTITNRIDEQKTVSVTKEWDASSFQAGLGNVEVEMTLYERVKGSTDKWVKSNPEKIIKMDEFSAVNASMSGSTTVPTYNALGQEMEYRFFETKITQEDKVYDVTPTEQELQSGEIEDKKFELTYNGNTVDFISKQPTDTDIGEGSATIVNSIQDEITYTIDKIWVDPLEPKEVSFALYQQGQGQVNTYVGTVTLDGEADTGDQTGDWKGINDTTKAVLTVGEKTYDITYQVTEGNFEELVIEGLPRYDEHGYSYEYIIVEMPGEGFAADYETTIDESGNYTTIVTNAPGEGHRILVRKRWIDNSDVQHREPVTITAYYADGGDFKDDKALGSVTLGASIEGTGQTGAWYDYISLDWQKVVGEVKDFDLNKVYIRETAIGDQTDVDTDEDSNLEIPGNRERVDNQITDRIDGEHHTYEVTYSIATLSPGQDGDGGDAGSAAGAQTFYVATNRRLGNIDMTVTKDWSSSTSLLDALKNSDIVPVVKLVVDTDKTNAEPPGEDQKIEDIINYDTNKITLTNDQVPILNNEGKQATAIQRLLDENGEPVETLYFFNLPKYDKDGRVANYTVVEGWCNKKDLDNGITKDEFKTLDQIKGKLKGEDDESKKLLELLDNLTATVEQEEYKENDGNHTNDTQTIAITNKLSGTKSIEFHKQWNDIYAFDSGKRPDLYLTLYQLTGDNLITEYREYRWDKSLQTEEGEGGQQGQGEETEEPPQEGGTETQAQDNYYWTCIFENLPKYDEDGNEIFYYAVENLAVTDPSTFHYAYPVFEYGEKTFDSVYGEGGKPSLPSKEDNKDDETGQEILKEVKDDKVALLEGGTFVNNLEEDVTINGVKLWANLPLTASEADLPGVTFNVYQHSSDENGDSVENGTLVAQLAIEDWSKLPPEVNKSGNQYTFTIDEVTVDVEGLNKGDPLPLYDAKGNRYTYKLVENLGKEGEDQNVDWTLVYHNETFNEYQITNTYDPQLGALSVKKLLEIPTVDSQQYYPAVTFELYQALPDENENYDFETATKLEDKTQVWTSGAVEEAAEGGTNLSGGGRLVEKVITFEDLPQYAPNGKEYKYFVVELIEGRMYYESAVVIKDVVLPGTGSRETVKDIFDKIFEEGHKPADESLPTQQEIQLTPNTETEDGSSETATQVPVSATFGDRYTTGDEITLQLTKIWEDQNNALGLRPSTEDFADSLKLYRSAPAQGGDGGAEGIDSEDITSSVEINVIVDDENSSHYIVTIKGTDEKTLEQYAPNGMPWVYKVTEDSTGKSWDVYITTPSSKQVQKSADQASEDGKLDLGTLTNTLETTHTFTKNWENAGDDNLTWENIGVEKMDVTGTLYVGVMNENGTGLQEDSEMKLASEFFTESQWNEWFKNLGGLGDEEENYKFEKSQTIDVGTKGEIKFENLPLVQKNEDSSTSPLVYVVAETKVEFEVGGKKYSQKFEPKFEVKDGSLTITYTPGNLTVDGAKSAENFFKPSDVTFKLSDLFNKSSSSSSATNAIDITELTIKKIWNDNNDAEKLRPESVDLVILQEKNDSQSGEESVRAALFTSRQAPNQTTLSDIDNVVLEGNGHVKVVTLSQANNWSETIANLPGLGFDDKGNLITYKYTVRELKEGWKQDGDPNVPMKDDLVDEANSKFNSYYTTSYGPEAGTVTNTLTHMDITAVKAWKPEGLHGDYAEVTFTLQSRVVGSGDDAWKDVADADGKPVSKKLTGEEDPAWTVTWTELPRTKNGQTLEYRVVEKLADSLKEEEHVQFSITPETISSESADKTFTFTVTNIPLGQITVTKKGEDGGLPNVEFTLTGNDGKSYKRTTSADGTATFTGLPLYDSNGTEITYTLKETSTPDGYIQLTEPIEVSFTAETKPEGVVYWATDSGYLLHEVEYEVVNGQYFQVVHTGGSGFYWPGVLGAGAAAAGVLYLIRRKTKGHNTER